MSETMDIAVSLANQAFLVYSAYLLTDFRDPQKRWRRAFFLFAAAITALNVALMLALGYRQFFKTVLLTMTVWYVGVVLAASKRRGWRAGLNICLVLFLGCVDWTAACVVMRFAPSQSWRLPVVCAGYLLLIPVVRLILRPIYFQMLRLLDRGWMLLCIGLLLLDVCMMMTHAFETTLFSQAFVLVIHLLCCVSGSLFIALARLFFLRVQREYEVRSSAALLSTQLSAMESRLDAIRVADEAIRIERHDLRHRLQTVAALVERNERTEALD